MGDLVWQSKKDINNLTIYYGILLFSGNSTKRNNRTLNRLR